MACEESNQGDVSGSSFVRILRKSWKGQFFAFPIFLALPGFPGGSEVKASAWNVGDPGSIPGLGRSPGEGNGNPLQYSCLENPMDRGAWWATVHGVAKSLTQLSTHTRTWFLKRVFQGTFCSWKSSYYSWEMLFWGSSEAHHETLSLHLKVLIPGIVAHIIGFQ